MSLATSSNIAIFHKGVYGTIVRIGLTLLDIVSINLK